MTLPALVYFTKRKSKCEMYFNYNFTYCNLIFHPILLIHPVVLVETFLKVQY